MTNKRSYGSQHIESGMANLLKPLFSGNKKHFLIINNIAKNWQKIVGKKYAKLCHPKSINFAKNTQYAKLTIAVYNSSVGFFLQSNSEILLEKIAALYGYKAVTKIIIKQEAREVEKGKKADAVLDKKSEKNLQESIKNVKDKELALTLARLGREVLGSDDES